MPDRIDALIESGDQVIWKCSECKATGEVDLERIKSAKGGALSLTDRHPPCRTLGCTYWVTFYAQSGMRSRALTTRAGSDRNSQRRTEWLKRQWAAQSKTPPILRPRGALAAGNSQPLPMRDRA